MLKTKDSKPAETKWKHMFVMAVMSTFIFAAIFTMRPTLIIHPVVAMGVLHRTRYLQASVIKTHPDHTLTEEEMLQSTILNEKTTNSTEYSEYIVPLANQTLCQKYPDTNDWTFHCSVPCEAMRLTGIKTTNIDVIKSCSMLEESVTWSQTANRTLFHVPFQSRCLDNLIRDYCQTSTTVPNIAHYVWFSRKEMNFYHFLSFLSVLKHLNPCLILVHGDVPYGLYWEYIMMITNNIINVKMKPPATIFGKKIGRIEHQADVARLLILQEYGGIYIDTDEIILRSMEDLMNYSFTLSHAVDNNLSNGLILSEPNATFLSYWLDGYKTYNKAQWAYHSTILPHKLSLKHPDLLHIENKTFVRPNYTQLKLLFRKNFNWSKNYGIHLYIRFYKRMHTSMDVRRLNTTMGSVARYILYDTKELCFDA
ncbi:uncharacterized protein LOC134234859 isoform X1 [Saccostrea cucullata]|uniref:uncharacterized protein LOC134234859 isoform X1 n=1 Tax=Saccostrea cuccullata TaxID=36930 RepID=UPI002ED1AC03